MLSKGKALHRVEDAHTEMHLSPEAPGEPLLLCPEISVIVGGLKLS